MPEIYVVGGCNGSGKTTFALTIFPNIDNIEFVNADIIAAELSPNNPDRVAIRASKIMLQRLKDLAHKKQDFAFETTLAARSFASFLRKCQTEDYQINLIYVWLNSIDLAISRVALRVASGGHNIPEDVIRRRYNRGRRNFLELYSLLADYWIAYDNTKPEKKAIAEKTPSSSIIIYEKNIWQQINQK